jgi:uncharacterized membrane protein
MKKNEFAMELTQRLSFLPWEEIQDRVNFYREMIDDRMEEGLSEEEAVAQIGSVEDIVAQIIADTPFTKLVKEKLKPKKRMKAWEIVLLVLGSPIWLALGISAFAVVLALYICLWAVIVSLWSVFGSLVGGGFGLMVAGIVIALGGEGLTGIAVLGAGCLCVGLSILAFYGCKMATKGTLLLTKKLAVWIKTGFAKKEDA